MFAECCELGIESLYFLVQSGDFGLLVLQFVDEKHALLLPICELYWLFYAAELGGLLDMQLL
jgi:hypothetical protein